MDDVPPGPTALGPRRPALSVVIPVYNGGSGFGRCLRRLRESLGADFELIVVDDGSTDDSAAQAAESGARLIQHATPRGPAAARNEGAEAARGALVFFLDADVAIHPEALARAAARFEADPGLTALFGSYDDEPDAPGLVSRFRNLLHHYTHQQGEFTDGVRPVHTFWTGCGMIRRRAFLDVGGFDPRRYVRPAIEDIELGYRLTHAGCRIVLARDVLGTHLKRWTLASVVRTDIFQRGVPWVLLLKRQRIAETDLNVRPGQKLCVAATGLAVLSLLGSFWTPWMLVGAVVGALAIVGLNRSFYRFLARKEGIGFAAGSVALHLIYYLCCGLSVVIAEALWQCGAGRVTSRRDAPRPKAIGASRSRSRSRRKGETRWIGR